MPVSLRNEELAAPEARQTAAHGVSRRVKIKKLKNYANFFRNASAI